MVEKDNPWDDPEFISRKLGGIEKELQTKRVPMAQRIEEATDELRKKISSVKPTINLVDASNTQPVGYPDYLGRMHNIMDSKNPIARHKIFDDDYRYEKRKKGMVNRRGRWGPWKNETRKNYTKRSKQRIERAYVDLVNKKLSDTEGNS